MKALIDNNEVKGWRGLPKLCTVAQLAANFRCSRSTIYKNIYREEVGKDGMWADKVNGRWRIPRIEAAHWFNRPMREAMASLIHAACSDDGGPIKIYIQPNRRSKADFNSAAMEPALETTRARTSQIYAKQKEERAR